MISTVIITGEAKLLVDLMNKDVVALGTIVVIGKAFNVLHGVVEASSNHECLVAVLLAVVEGKLVGFGVQLGDFSLLNPGPIVDHGLGILGITLESLDVTREDAEVALRLRPHELVRHESHLHLVSARVRLQVLGDCSRVGTT